jgi:hypothetical protein
MLFFGKIIIFNFSKQQMLYLKDHKVLTFLLFSLLATTLARKKNNLKKFNKDFSFE